MKQPVQQKHHVIYKSEKNKELVYSIRRGVHQVITLLRRHSKGLTDEEIHVIKLETEMLRRF